MKTTCVKSSQAKREFGKYFKKAIKGNPVVIDNALTDERAVLVSYDFFEEMMEIFYELQDKKLNKQIKDSYHDYKKGKFKKGLGVLIDIMDQTIKKELMN